MKKSIKVALSGLGLATAVAVPLAVVACGETVIELTEEDKGLLTTTNAETFGSQKVEASLMDIIQGKTIAGKDAKGNNVDIKNYLIFIGTTACPVCNTYLTNQNTRTKYSQKQDINTYTGPFVTAALRLQSAGKIDKTFIWEDLAPGYGDPDSSIPNSTRDNFPWSAVRADEATAKTFKAVEKYYQISSYRSPLIIAVVNNSPKIVSGFKYTKEEPITEQQFYDAFVKDYFVDPAS